MYKYKITRDILFLSDIYFPISLPALPERINQYLIENGRGWQRCCWALE